MFRGPVSPSLPTNLTEPEKQSGKRDPGQGSVRLPKKKHCTFRGRIKRDVTGEVRGNGFGSFSGIMGTDLLTTVAPEKPWASGDFSETGSVVLRTFNGQVTQASTGIKHVGGLKSARGTLR